VSSRHFDLSAIPRFALKERETSRYAAAGEGDIDLIFNAALIRNIYMDVGIWEYLSYVVTVVGLPLAIIIFIYEQRKERDNEEEEVYQLLSDNYQGFLQVVLEHPDLQLFSEEQTPDLTAEQREQMIIIFSMLVSLFERAYLLQYEDEMTPKQLRRWRSWEDSMREWCERADFRAALPELLRGEDPDFAKYIQKIADTESKLDS
jgi:hypothetical protein